MLWANTFTRKHAVDMPLGQAELYRQRLHERHPSFRLVADRSCGNHERTQTLSDAQVKGQLCVTVRFPEKLDLLMRRRALSNLSLGKALGGIAHTTVARWRAGSVPRGNAARLLANYFEIPVEVLTDDKQDLSAPTRTEAIIQDIEPGTKWGEAPRELRGRAATAVFLDSKAGQDILKRAEPFLPQLKAIVDVLEMMAKPPQKEPAPDLDTVERDLKQAQAKLKGAGHPGPKHRSA